MSLYSKTVIAIALLSFGYAATAKASDDPPRLDRSLLPIAVRSARLDHLSSGALLLLDRDGDLVETPEQHSARVAAMANARPIATAESVSGLDPRVGSNIRLGNDPAPLPANMRAQAEPHVARAPTNSDLLLATFQEGRFAAGGGAVDCGYSVSHDGGLSWTRALIPNLTSASGGSYVRATDPVAASSADGILYLNTIGATNQAFTTAAVLVSRSTDGGNTFARPVVVYRSPDTSVMPDKNWIAVNTFAGTSTVGRVVVAFAYFTSANPNGAAIARCLSDDGGQTWSAPGFIHPSDSDTQGAQPVFLPNGKVAIVYANFNHTAANNDDFLELVVSDDGGDTFRPPKLIAHYDTYSEPQIRNGGFLPSATTDRSTGALFVAHQARSAGSPRIIFTKSTDNGNTWTSPIAVSDNPTGSGVFNPAIAASDDGQTLTVTFYDHRNNPSSQTLVDMYLAQSFDGGATWQPNIRITPVSTDASLAPRTSEGYMLGDYLGVAPAVNANVPAVPIWIDTRTGNPDPFVARIGIAPAFNFTSWEAAYLSLGQISNPEIGGEAGDPDADGEDNRSEFMADTDPNNAASVVRTGSQLNIATRARVGADDESLLIGGFIITGNSPKRVIARALGPSLAARGVTGVLQDPTLELVPANGARIFNDNWQDSDAAAIQATGIPPDDARESAIVQTLAPGGYTAVVRGQNHSTGVALVEIYDLSPGNGGQLRNLSSRSLVGVADDVMIAGFIVGAGAGVDGYGSVRVVVRGIGPSLTARGIGNPLQNPNLVIFNSNGDVLASNDDWRQTQQAEIQATGLAPQDNREAAIVMPLPKGIYTVVLRGAGDTTGVALVEVYQVD